MSSKNNNISPTISLYLITCISHWWRKVSESINVKSRFNFNLPIALDVVRILTNRITQYMHYTAALALMLLQLMPAPLALSLSPTFLSYQTLYSSLCLPRFTIFLYRFLFSSSFVYRPLVISIPSLLFTHIISISTVHTLYFFSTSSKFVTWTQEAQILQPYVTSYIPVLQYQHKLLKMRAELVYLNHCAVPFF